MRMKNSFSPIWNAVQEVFEEQSAPAATWSDGAVIIEAVGADKKPIWWFKHSEMLKVLDNDQVEKLKGADVLENDGQPMKKRFGRTYELAMGLRVEEIKKLARTSATETTKLQLMTRELKNLERQLKAARNENVADYAMASLIDEIRQAYKVSGPGPVMKINRAEPSKTKALAGVPSLLLSDWHWGEVVDPSQIQYLNEFNLEIAHRRADRVFSETLELLLHHQAGMTYDGFTLILGGDLFSGNIHEELRATNEAPIHECMLVLAEKLAGAIIEVADNFPWVYVPGVVGNHGRIDHKPTSKYAVKDNYDWLLYNIVMLIVKGRMGDKCNVEFDISTSLDIPFNLYNTRFMLTHGDQISSGSGMGGIWPEMMKVAARKQQRAVKGGMGGFDYMVCGHFHKYGNISNLMVNGSLKGYDEWAYKMNLEWERPIQALWTTHPEYGITSHIPVYAEEAVADGLSNVPPVTPSSALRKVK